MYDKFEILKEISEWEKEIARLEDSDEDEEEQISEIKERINTLRLALDEMQTSEEMKERYIVGIKAVREGLDESDDILCPVCNHSLACNDDYYEMRPKHCEECGTKIIY